MRAQVELLHHPPFALVVKNEMNIAQQIVEALLEGDDEKKKTKNMPDWLKRIKGIKDDDDADDDKSEGGESKEKKSDSDSKGGGSAKSSDTTVGKTW